MSKVALITGITGQDGSFLAEFLIEKGYEVHGILRRSSSFNTARIEHLYLDEWVRDMKKSRLINLHWGDMTDSSSLIRIISHIRPNEIYNLAAQSHVKVSFDVPEYTAEADAVGTLRLLEAVRICGLEKTCRIYQASTSELFGMVQQHDLLKFGIIPELVGRLPVITCLKDLKKEDLVRILEEPKNALTKQYKKLLDQN